MPPSNSMLAPEPNATFRFNLDAGPIILRNNTGDRLMREDPVFTSSRREAATVMAIWVLAMAWSVSYCYLFGYHRSLDSLTFIFGFPDWIFWGIVTPWLVCCLISAWFSFRFMRDEDLGSEPADEGVSNV